MKKIKSYLFACLPFLMMMGIILIVPNIIFLGLSFLYSILDGPGGFYTAIDIYNNHLDLITCAFYLCALIPAALWYYHKFYKKGQPLQKNRHFRPSSVAYIVLLALGVAHAIDLLFILIAILSPQTMDNYVQLIEDSGLTSYSVAWFFSTLVLPPLVEELIFRGLTLRLFRRAGVSFYVANFLQALLFGIFHMNIVQGIYAFLLGLLMGYLVNHYHTLLAGMAFHACFNLFGTFLSDLESQFFNNTLALLVMLLGILLTIAMICIINREAPPTRRRPTPMLLQSPYEDSDTPFI